MNAVGGLAVPFSKSEITVIPRNNIVIDKAEISQFFSKLPKKIRYSIVKAHELSHLINLKDKKMEGNTRYAEAASDLTALMFVIKDQKLTLGESNKTINTLIDIRKDGDFNHDSRQWLSSFQEYLNHNGFKEINSINTSDMANIGIDLVVFQNTFDAKELKESKDFEKK